MNRSRGGGSLEEKVQKKSNERERGQEGVGKNKKTHKNTNTYNQEIGEKGRSGMVKGGE